MNRAELAARVMALPPAERANAIRLVKRIYRRPQLSFSDFIREAWHVVEPSTPYQHGWHIDAIAEALEAVTNGEVRDLVINMPPRHGKPESVDTLVLMSNGARKRLGDLVVGDRVVTHLGRVRCVEGIEDVGLRDCVRLTAHSGRQTTPAVDHPMLTPRGWTLAGDLVEGDTLAIVSNPELEGEADAAQCRMAGYFIGDGNVTQHGSTLAATMVCFDPVQTEDIKAQSALCGFVCRDSVTRGKLNFSGGVRDWLRATGIAGGTSHSKRVPEFVLRGGRRAAAEFIAAYFCCDGSLNAKGGARRDLEFTITSVSHGLLSDVRHLLARLGIRSRIRHRITDTSSFKAGVHFWILSVTSADAVARFIERIPLVGAKADRLSKWNPLRTDFEGPYLPDEIVNIERTATDCRCIQVEEDQSYVGDDFATHNSLLVAVFWPAWSWTFKPESRWLFASYAAALSKRDSLKCRRVVTSDWYRRNFPDVELCADQNEKMRFDNTATGYRLATSVDGMGTGDGGDFIVVDDPHNVRERESVANREAVLTWWDESMSTRLNDPQTGARVIVQQRVHQRDLSGHVLEEKEGYTHLNLPARFESAHPRGVSPADQRTVEGEPLWPERFTPEVLDKIARDLGSYAAAGQLQQRPAPASGGIWKRHWWGFWQPEGANLPPVMVRVEGGGYESREAIPLPRRSDEKMQSWDMAFVKTDTSSYVVGQCWQRTAAQKFLLDQVRERMDFPQTCSAVEAFAKKHPDARAKVVEKKANGAAVLATLRLKVSGLIPETPTESKEARAAAQAPDIEAGDVFLPHPLIAPWVEDFIEESATFPNAAHDDQVDCASQALKRLAGKRDSGSSRPILSSRVSPWRM